MNSFAYELTDDVLSQREFNLLAAFIYDYCGIKMPESKRSMLEGRLKKRLRATGHNTFKGYCDFVFSPEGQAAEVVFLIDVVTTNKTDFFREPRHFEFLEKVALPTLASHGYNRVKTWSSACSNGAEPYTMAMVLQEAVDRGVISEYNVLATDLSTDVLEKAYQGIYSTEIAEPIPQNLYKKYVMTARDMRRKEVRIVPKLRSRVSFGRMNLMDAKYEIGGMMHIIFCRNVLIYFDKQTQTHVLTQLCKNLMSGGYLMIGHSESLTGIDLPVDQVANTIFVKR
jgi:chemotaxis protein methyltransferase CheR